MNLQQTFYNSLLAGENRRVPEDVDIKTAAAFHATLAKERARVDRNSHVFSLVSFETTQQNFGMNTTTSLAAHLKKHMRITDEIGLLDNHTIGVLLFNALNEEAKLFIEKIKRDHPQIVFSNYSISTYPEGTVAHPHVGDAGLESRNSCQNSFPGTAASQGHHRRASDEQISLQLQPVFFDKMSVCKRLFDVAVSSIALIALSPFMLAIAIAIKCTSRGPIFFRQNRAGLGGVPFRFLKFRTMDADAEWKKTELLQFNERSGPVFKMENDPRVTRLGSFLRKWSLDELPQFINVLMGDMSLVGPRPPTLDEVEQYKNWHSYRLEIKPGITCIWQVCARHEKSFENWGRLDIKYRKEQSLLLDLKLLVLTVPAVLSRRGAN